MCGERGGGVGLNRTRWGERWGEGGFDLRPGLHCVFYYFQFFH